MHDEPTDIIVRELPLAAEPCLRLRRAAGSGSWWELVDGRGRPVAAVTALQAEQLAGGRTSAVAEATRTELEYWDLEGAWQGSFVRPHPSPLELVQELLCEWRDLYCHAGEPERASVDAALLPFTLRGLREAGDAAVRLTVVRHGAAASHAATVEAVLGDVDARQADTIAIVGTDRGYVQLMDRKELPTVYLEAADPHAQEFGALSPAARSRLRDLGWSDPKVDLVPYPDPAYANEWQGKNFAREWPRDAGLAELSRIVAATLCVYGTAPAADLDVDLFAAVR